MARVLIVDDSPVVRAVLKDWITAEKDMEVAGEAKDGLEAFEMTRSLKPEIVLMDIMMPRMNGLEATEKIMAYCPTPVLIFSSVVNDREMNIVFEAISRGALDVLAKPSEMNDPQNRTRRELLKKVRILSKVPVIKHPLGKLKTRRQESADAGQAAAGTKTRPGEFAILGIGASTGGPKALSELLAPFPRNFPAPVVVVQHIADAFIEGLARWLASLTRLAVKIPAQDELLKPGTVYLAPSNQHMLVRDSRIQLSDADPVNNCRPAVDILFNSLAENYGARTVAVLLTGMGADGARGMKAIHEKGGRTVVQDEASSVVFGMPGSAIEMGAVDEVIPLEKIPAEIFEAFGLTEKEGEDKWAKKKN